jgi:GT2 family glycosyltransferase
MPYAIVDAELTAPELPDVQLDAGEDGVALLLRAGGRPVHFALYPLDAGARLDGGELWELAREAAAPALLAQTIRDELAPPPAVAAADVTAAVCTRARTALLADCLGSLLALGDGVPEVLVVDNDPPDGATEELVAGLRGVRYVREPRAGLDFARNRALREAGTEYVAFLDDDVVVDREWRRGLDEAIAENPDCGAVTGLVLPRELRTRAQLIFEQRGGFRRGTQKLRYAGPHLPGNPLYPVGAGIFGAGCDMVVRRELVLSLGGFDEALDTGPPLPGGGDLDIFHRVVAAGEPLVYEPRMLVFHRHREDLRGLRRQYRSWGEGFMAYLAKTYASEPDARGKVRAMARWWVSYASRNVVTTLAGRRPGPVGLAAAELGGGVVGLLGGYRRSQRRTAAIRERHAA